MTGFPGQISAMRYGTPGIVWHIQPFYLKVIYPVIVRAKAVLGVTET